MRKNTPIIVFVLLLIFICATAYAEAESNPAYKLGRGITNMASCWLEVPKQIYLTSKEYNPLIGFTFGIMKGAAYTVLRGSAGVYDTTTFLLPKYDLLLMEPQFVTESW